MLTYAYTGLLAFRKLRMIDIEEFRNRLDAMELTLFQNLCMRHIDAAKEKLLKKQVMPVHCELSV